MNSFVSLTETPKRISISYNWYTCASYLAPAILVLYRLFAYRCVSVLHVNGPKLSDTCLHIFLGMYHRLNRCAAKKFVLVFLIVHLWEIMKCM